MGTPHGSEWRTKWRPGDEWSVLPNLCHGRSEWYDVRGLEVRWGIVSSTPLSARLPERAWWCTWQCRSQSQALGILCDGVWRVVYLAFIV